MSASRAGWPGGGELQLCDKHVFYVPFGTPAISFDERKCDCLFEVFIATTYGRIRHAMHAWLLSWGFWYIYFFMAMRGDMSMFNLISIILEPYTPEGDVQNCQVFSLLCARQGRRETRVNTTWQERTSSRIQKRFVQEYEHERFTCNDEFNSSYDTSKDISQKLRHNW